jgi:hypothetical protein
MSANAWPQDLFQCRGDAPSQPSWHSQLASADARLAAEEEWHGLIQRRGEGFWPTGRGAAVATGRGGSGLTHSLG